MPQLAGLKPAQKRKIHQELESGKLTGDADWASREVWDEEPPPSPTKSFVADAISTVSAPTAAAPYGVQHYRSDAVALTPSARAIGVANGAVASSSSGPMMDPVSHEYKPIPGSYAAAAAGTSRLFSSAVNIPRRFEQ